MKTNKLLLAIGVIIVWCGLHSMAHGAATIKLNNYDVDIPIRLMWSADSQGTNLNYQVLGGPVGQSLTPISPAWQTNTVFNWETCRSFAGYFDVGVGIVPGIPDGSPADFQVRAWVGLPGSTYEEASVRGESIRWTQNTGSWDSAAFPPIPAEGTMLNIPEKIAYPQDNYFLLAVDCQGKGDISLSPPPLFSGYSK